MQSVNECFNIVCGDCLKFIKSQESKTEKFKNKNRMIKSFLIPVCFWIFKKASKKKPLILGLSGGQGIGKTTISSIITLILKKYFKLNIFKISIDDFYKTRKERFLLSKKIHSLLMTRGVPGTHDINIMLNFFKRVKKNNFKSLKLPKFDKAIDDRCKKSSWYTIKKRPNVIIFEGWCVGARAQKNSMLKKSINSLEKTNDQNLIWRKFVNNQLKTKYKKLFGHLDNLLYLKAKNFNLLQQWRIKQEKKLWLKLKKRKNLKIMNKLEVINFMQTYQRITQNMIKDVPKYASIIFKLNSNHQIKTINYRK
jgi:D-glycerate 3-kinase